MPYDISGRGIDPDENDHMILKAALGFIGALLIIGLVSFVISDAPRETPQETSASILKLDTNNAALMHQYGMPTKADVMEWHYTGQWGYRASSSFYVYADLPGDKQAWDDFYGIDGGNPAFDK